MAKLCTVSRGPRTLLDLWVFFCQNSPDALVKQTLEGLSLLTSVFGGKVTAQQQEQENQNRRSDETVIWANSFSKFWNMPSVRRHTYMWTLRVSSVCPFDGRVKVRKFWSYSLVTHRASRSMVGNRRDSGWRNKVSPPEGKMQIRFPEEHSRFMWGFCGTYKKKIVKYL